jgi:hypothetical protein
MATNFRILKPILLLTPALLCTVFLCGCVSYTLRKAEIGGPIVQSPIRLTADKKGGDMELTSYVSVPSDTALNGGNSTASSTTPEFSWTLPDWNAGLHAERAFSDHWVGGLGLNYSRVSLNNEVDQLFGGDLSLGVYWSQRNWGLRADASAIMQHNTYVMEFLRQEESMPDQIFTDRGRETEVNGAISFTLNSSVDSWPANLFASLQLGTNTFYVFEHGENDRDFSIGYQSYTLGLFRNIGRRVRIAGGFRTARSLEIEEGGMAGQVVEPVSEVVMQISVRNR